MGGVSWDRCVDALQRLGFVVKSTLPTRVVLERGGRLVVVPVGPVNADLICELAHVSLEEFATAVAKSSSAKKQ